MKNFCYLIILIATAFSCYSQKLQEEFYLLPSETKFSSIYNKLKVLDLRRDTTNLGTIQKGLFNRKAVLKSNSSLKNQIESLFSTLINENAGKNELLLSLRDFKFGETTSSFSEIGFCSLNADLYSKQGNDYYKIATIFDVFEVSSIDVTTKNILNGSDRLVLFLIDNLKNDKFGDVFSFSDIMNMENIEKSKIPIYNVANFKDGIYTSYESFKMQLPNLIKFKVKKDKNNNIKKIESYDDNNELVDMRPEQLFAIIADGKIYKSCENNYTPIEFKNNNFCYVAEMPTTANNGNIVVASVLFGVIGGIIASSSSSAYCELILDHRNGAPIIIKQVIK